MNSRIKISVFALLLSISINVFSAGAFDCPGIVKNIMLGHFSQTNEAFKIRKVAFEKELVGLNYVEIIPWEQNHKDKAIRRLVRRHGITSLLSKNIPEFDHTQKVGPAKIHINDIHFTQYSASNHTGDYTVVGNAQSFKAGSLDPSKFPRLQVWRDVSGKIWSLDHRRLVSMVLAGYDKELDVEFVPFEVFKEDRFKFSNMDDGNSIILDLTKKDDVVQVPIAVIVSKKNRSSKSLYLKQTKERSKFHETEISNTKEWELSRGEDYLLLLEKYSSTLSEEYELANKRLNTEFKSLMDGFFEIQSRAKNADSVLAKLLRKDQSLFQKGLKIESLDAARALIGDGVGFRVFLKSSKDGAIDKTASQRFVNALAKNIKNGKIRVTEILNYRPKDHDSLAYFSDEQIKMLIEADLQFGLSQKVKGVTHKPMIVKNGPGVYNEMGYTSFHFNFSAEDEVLGEVQVRGNSLHGLLEARHIFYDIKQGKPISTDLLKDQIIASAVKSFIELSSEKKSVYYSYISSLIVHYRRIELGQSSKPPALPEGFSNNLELIKLKDHFLSISH